MLEDLSISLSDSTSDMVNRSDDGRSEAMLTCVSRQSPGIAHRHGNEGKHRPWIVLSP